MTLEWKLTEHESVQNNTGTPNVTFLREEPFRKLRSDIKESSDQAWFDLFVFLHLNRCSEVDQPNLKVAAVISYFFEKNDVFHFQVTMNHALSVQIIENRNDLLHNYFYRLFGNVAFVRWVVFFQASTFTKFGDDIIITIVKKQIIEFDDVWVVKNLQNVHFSDKIDLRSLVHGFFLQSFDSPDFIGALLNSSVDISEAALADFFLDFIKLENVFLLYFDEITNVDLHIFIGLGNRRPVLFFIEIRLDFRFNLLILLFWVQKNHYRKDWI